MKVSGPVSATSRLVGWSRSASSSSSLRLKDLPTPAFVVNRHAFEKNCRSMLEMARERNLALRPHVKTHKTIQGAWIQATGAWSDPCADGATTGTV